jgi:hypothetical protein
MSGGGREAGLGHGEQAGRRRQKERIGEREEVDLRIWRLGDEKVKEGPSFLRMAAGKEAITGSSLAIALT